MGQWKATYFNSRTIDVTQIEWDWTSIVYFFWTSKLSLVIERIRIELELYFSGMQFAWQVWFELEDKVI